MKKFLIILLLLILPTFAMADMFSVDSVNTVMDATRIYSFSAANNYGIYASLQVGAAVSLGRLYRSLIRFPSIDDTLTALGGTADSAILFLQVVVPVGDGDTLYLVGYPLLRYFEEGFGNGLDTCGADWTHANDYNHTGCLGSDIDWTTAGAGSAGNDYTDTRILQWWNGASYQDSIEVTIGSFPDNDTVSLKIDGQYVNELYGNGILLAYSTVKDSTEDGNCNISFHSDDAADPKYYPYVWVYYTIGEEETTGRRRRLYGGNR